MKPKLRPALCPVDPLTNPRANAVCGFSPHMLRVNPTIVSFRSKRAISGVRLSCIGLFPAITPLTTITPNRTASNLFIARSFFLSDLVHLLKLHRYDVFPQSPCSLLSDLKLTDRCFQHLSGAR